MWCTEGCRLALFDKNEDLNETNHWNIFPRKKPPPPHLWQGLLGFIHGDLK